MITGKIIIPFGTGPLDWSGSEGEFYSDAELKTANMDITGIYPVQSLEEGVKLVQAADALGFAYELADVDPNNEGAYIYVKIWFRAAEDSTDDNGETDTANS